MPDFNITAIVLRRMQYGETDNILTLYSRERGRISAIAKGARKAVSRLSGATELLCRSKFSLASAKTLQIVRQAEVVASYPALREDLTRLANGLYAADLLSAFVTDDDPNPDLFDLLDAALNLISVVKAPSLAARWYEIRLLDELGYAPILTECIFCRAALSPARPGIIALSASQGGVLCHRHCDPQRFDDQSALSRPSLQLLQRLSDLKTLPDLFDNGILENREFDDRQTAYALRRYIRFRTDHDLKSLQFLDTLRKSD